MELFVRKKRRVRGVGIFFKGKSRAQRKTTLLAIKSFLQYLMGDWKALSLEDGVFCLDGPPLLPCPLCSSCVELLNGSITSGSGITSDTMHFLRCIGHPAHQFTIRLLPALPKKQHIN